MKRGRPRSDVLSHMEQAQGYPRGVMLLQCPECGHSFCCERAA